MTTLESLMIEILSKGTCNVHFPDINTRLLAGCADYELAKALTCIRAVLQNPENTDFDCVEGIVSILEGINLDAGSRHDFG